jgi:thiol:disulfide interchange protein
MIYCLPCLRTRRYLAAFTFALAAGAGVLPLPASCGDAAAVTRYDAARDAAGDIDRALVAARAGGRRVLLNIGGDWCKDCRELDALFAADPALAALRDRRYIPVKVFVGSENRNEAVLARYPKLDWVPTLIELDTGGRMIRLSPSTEFHEGDKLAAARIRAFLAGP